MKRTVLCLVSFLLLLSCGKALRAEDDARVIDRLSHTGPADLFRTASLYLTFDGNKADGLPAVPSGDETRFYIKVWDDLYLQVTTETGENGTTGYMFAFSRDETDQKALDALENKDVPTLREIAAPDFRTDDNFAPRPLQVGPGKLKDRGALRIVPYPGFTMEVRVLEFKIGDAKLGKKPYFKSLSCLVTVKETKGK